MSSWAATPVPLGAASSGRPARASRRLAEGRTRLAVFAAMSLFASLQYASLLQHIPAARVLAIVALAATGGAVLQLIGLRARGHSRAALALLAGLATLLLALLAAGIPSHLLVPDGWGALVRHLEHGVTSLGAWLWPYRGDDVWAERAVLLVLPVLLTAAAALCFWPTRSPRRREAGRGAALLLLVALYVVGVANEPARLDGLRGLVLGVLVAAWLWLPGLRVAEAPRAARWLLAGVLVALLMRPLLSSPSSWIDYRETSGSVQLTASFQWDQLYGPIPWSRSGATMFEVTEPHPGLLRVTSLDRFDGLRFLRSAAPAGLRRLDFPRARSNGGLRTATVSIAGLRSQLLVSGGGVARTARWLGARNPLLTREADGTFAAPATVSGGALYKLTSYEPTATPAQLRAAPRTFSRAYLPYAQFDLPGRGASGLSHPNLLLEARQQPTAGTLVGPARPGARPAEDALTELRIADSPYGAMFALAQRLARGAHSSYEVALRIREYLLANYGYSEHVAQARYPLEAFLFSQQLGYCQQFSGTMTLMLRMEGIPARVGAGFKPTVYDPRTQGWRVRALDAHSWVEVFFTGIGWVVFDPTPDVPLSAAESEGARSKVVIEGGAIQQAPRTQKQAAASRLPATSGSGGGFPVLLTVLAACAALAGGLSARAWLLARRRLRDGLSGAAEGAVGELSSALAVLQPVVIGRPRHAALAVTLTQLETQLRERGRDAAADYVGALNAARYARPPREREPEQPGGQREPALDSREQRPTRRGRAALRRALAEQAGRRGALRVLALMPPGVTRRV